MILNRLGNKRRLASKIITYIPNHTLYIELFFGAGGLFFNKKPIAPHNILNDLDDVFSLLVGSGHKFAISEFSHPQILELATEHGLFVNYISERRTIKSRNTEVLITNYPPPRQTLFCGQ